MLKKEYKNILILFLILLILIIIPTGFNLFGSNTDWINQHIVFPEYLRQLFYDTKNILPNFTFNLGAGENIFNIAYYGLLNPIILLSYLFPFIEMKDYIIGISIISLFVTTVLFYKWVRNSFSEKISLLISIIFITSGPLIFQAHRHIMFVNYMPFLILGLMGIDKLLKDNKKTLLIVSIFLCLMTSYYYSIEVIIVLYLYFIFKKLENNIKIKKIIKDTLFLTLYILIAILMSMILILPVLYTLTLTRGENIFNLSLLIPNIDPTYILYGAYSLGLTSIALISILWLTFKNKISYRFLGIILIILFFVPAVSLILNGGLYIRAKVFIPFIPLICMIIGLFIKDLFDNKVKIKDFIIYIIIVNIICLICKTYSILYYLDLISLIIILILYNKFNNRKIIYIPITIISILSSFYMNFTEEYVNYKKYNSIFSADINYLISDIDKTYRVSNLLNSSYTVNKIYNTSYYTTNIYSSIYNNYYYNFVRNEFRVNNPYYNSFLIGSVNNILFNTIMGNKYIISNDNPGNGYELLNEIGNIKIYKNDNAFSIGYVNTNLMSEEYYNTLNYPYNVEAILNNVIVNKDISIINTTNIEKTKLKYKAIYDNINVSKLESGYNIITTSNKKIKLELDTPLNNKILFIDFTGLKPNSCDIDDISITINGIKNILTCDTWTYPNNNTTFYYVINEEYLDTLDIEFSEGNFNIENINIYTLDYDNLIKNYDWFKVSSIKDNKIEGNIDVKNKGYFVLTIPYDKGFEIFVDGEKIDYELVNKAFIGFSIDSGYHDIKIVYNSPYLKEGIVLSCIGFALFIGVFIMDKKKSR
ncbi:MAG: YfhO family protein [Clostridium sp.]|nr:YfhO family protein [Clostridium sp.]MCM1444463.1 YfhO family protein [Candidatus Amulumruptor caecigallinarius]